jgi:hypothetical protein
VHEARRGDAVRQRVMQLGVDREAALLQSLYQVEFPGGRLKSIGFECRRAISWPRSRSLPGAGNAEWRT